MRQGGPLTVRLFPFGAAGELPDHDLPLQFRCWSELSTGPKAMTVAAAGGDIVVISVPPPDDDPVSALMARHVEACPQCQAFTAAVVDDAIETAADELVAEGKLTAKDRQKVAKATAG